MTSGLRQATAADLPSVQQVIAAAYGKYLARMDRPPAPLLRDYSSAIERGKMWVTGSPVVGLISLSQTDDVILIENVAVHPAEQGTGVGRRLMEFAEDLASHFVGVHSTCQSGGGVRVSLLRAGGPRRGQRPVSSRGWPSRR